MNTQKFKTSTRSKTSKSKNDLRNNQFGPAKKGDLACSHCGNIFYKKRWHDQNQITGEHKDIKYVICPACLMVKNNTYEGEIIISNIPAQIEKELFNLVSGFDKRAQYRDPQDRVIEIKKQKGSYRITTTENQLAVKLAKKIKETFHGAELNISYSKDPQDVARIKLIFNK